MPKQISCTPPRNNTALTVLDQPLIRPGIPNKRLRKTTAIPNTAEADVANPVQVARRSGTTEKEKIPSSANRTILRKENFVIPAARRDRRYSTALCENPSQLTIPLTKRSRSGMDSSASTARRSISRKSPVSRGIRVSESLDKTIKQVRRPQFESRFTLTLGANPVDDVIAVQPL